MTRPTSLLFTLVMGIESNHGATLARVDTDFATIEVTLSYGFITTDPFVCNALSIGFGEDHLELGEYSKRNAG